MFGQGDRGGCGTFLKENVLSKNKGAEDQITTRKTSRININ